jgi:hypothetical protein
MTAERLRLAGVANDFDSLVHANLERIQPRPTNVSVVLVGDSVTRYQYLSLAHFLRHGMWPDPLYEPSFSYFGAHSHPQHREHWSEYFYQTNRALHPNEVCDCMRDNANFRLERRYFYDPIRNNKLVFINLNGNEPTNPRYEKGRYFGSIDASAVFANFSQLLKGEFQPSRIFQNNPKMIAWEHGNWTDVLLQHVQKLDMMGEDDPHRAPAVILNAGLHEHDLVPEALAQLKMVSATQQRHNESLVSSSSSLSSSAPAPWRWIWKTTTHMRPFARGIASEESWAWRHAIDATDRQFCSILECFNVSWTLHVCPNMFYDAPHFREPVYRLLNEQLLDLLDLTPSGYVPLDPSRAICQPPPPPPPQRQ